jgi:two-component system response regulator PilR (NtrC family)
MSDAAVCRRSATTVLVADDDDDFRALMVETLTSDGYLVLEARDGVELLSLLDEASGSSGWPDIIIADVRMPRLSGLGVLEHLKRAQIRLPVVLITGFVPESVGVLAKRLGAFGVIGKPFAVDALREAVRSATRAYP